MTTKELATELFVLGGGEAISDDRLLAISVNRALRKLYTDREIVKTVRFASRSIPPIKYYEEIRCKNGEEVTIPINGIAFSMRIHGVGKYTITDGDSVNVYAFDSPNEAILIKRALIFGGSITFWGSFSFTVYDLSIYDQVFSPFTEDIPDYGPRRVFNVRELYTDFMCFISPATDKHGVPLKNCKLYDGKLEIDSSYDGEIVLTYRRMPTEIFISEVEQRIDLPDEYKAMFIPLVASYFLYFADEELAKYYRDRYEELLSQLKESSYYRVEYSYVDTNGWA